MRSHVDTAIDEAMNAVPVGAPRPILATGSYIGEGFDDARLDTPFLVMPICWKGTLQQYVGRLHRLRDGKQVVQVSNYADMAEPMLARMYERRRKAYASMGYELTALSTGLDLELDATRSQGRKETLLLGGSQIRSTDHPECEILKSGAVVNIEYAARTVFLTSS